MVSNCRKGGKGSGCCLRTCTDGGIQATSVCTRKSAPGVCCWCVLQQDRRLEMPKTFLPFDYCIDRPPQSRV